MCYNLIEEQKQIRNKNVKLFLLCNTLEIFTHLLDLINFKTTNSLKCKM